MSTIAYSRVVQRWTDTKSIWSCTLIMAYQVNMSVMYPRSIRCREPKSFFCRKVRLSAELVQMLILDKQTSCIVPPPNCRIIGAYCKPTDLLSICGYTIKRSRPEWRQLCQCRAGHCQGRTQDEKFSVAKNSPPRRSRAAGTETRHEVLSGVESGEGACPLGARGFDPRIFFWKIALSKRWF